MGLMEDKICLDSDVLIDFLKNKKEIVDWIKEKEENFELTTTAINVFELYYGEYKKKPSIDIKRLDKFFENIHIFDLTKEISKKAGELASTLEKEGNIIEFRDILIAAISIENNLSLKTNNIKHFSRIKELKIIKE